MAFRSFANLVHLARKAIDGVAAGGVAIPRALVLWTTVIWVAGTVAASALEARSAAGSSAQPLVQSTKPPPGTVFGDFLSGTVAGALGDSDAASARLLGVVGADPGNTDVRAQAFLFATLAGSPEAARLASGMTANPLAPLVLGNAAARRSDWNAAQASFNQVADSPLNALLRPLLVAWSQQGLGQTDAALNTLGSLAQSNPVAGVYALHAAIIADQAGRSDQAAQLYQQALALYPGSDLVLVQSYASFLARAGRPEEGRGLIHALVRALPTLSISEAALDAQVSRVPVANPVQGLARCYLTIASLTQQQGVRGREAESFMLRFALDLQPDLAPARLLLADLQTAAGAPQQALATLARVAPTDPLAPMAALRAGIIAAAAGRHTEARSTLERLVKAFPDRAEPLQALGDVFQDDGRYSSAVDAYTRAIRLMSPLKSGDWPILFSRATAFDRGQQWLKAQSDLRHALQLSPNQPFLLNYLGYSWLERKQDLGNARIMIERALDAKPEDGSIRDSLGWALFRQNDIAGAVRQLERAAEQMPEDPTVNYHLGAAYWSAGRKVEARDQWRWALILHPGKQDEARIRTALRNSMRPNADPVLAADALPLPHP